MCSLGAMGPDAGRRCQTIHPGEPVVPVGIPSPHPPRSAAKLSSFSRGLRWAVTGAIATTLRRSAARQLPRAPASLPHIPGEISHQAVPAVARGFLHTLRPALRPCGDPTVTGVQRTPHVGGMEPPGCTTSDHQLDRGPGRDPV